MASEAIMDEASSPIQQNAVPSIPATTPEGLERLYQRAKEKEARRQALAKEVQAAECTFKPQLIASTSRRSSRGDASPMRGGAGGPPPSPSLGGSSEERFNRLYQDAQERQAKRAIAKRQQEEEVQRAGRPAITTKAQQQQRGGDAAKAAPDRLYEEARKMDERKAKLRAEVIAKECTFKPQTGRAPSAPRTRGEGQETGGSTFAERAMEYKSKVERKVSALKKEKEQEEQATLTFKPSINTSKGPARQRDSSGSSSVFEHLARQAQQRSLSKGQKAEEEDPDCTFKPSIPKRSQSATRRGPPGSPAAGGGAGRSQTPVFQRLYEERTAKEDKLRVLQQQQLEESTKDCTFTPRTAASASGSRAPRPTPEGGLSPAPRHAGAVTPTSVFSRLYDEFKAQEQRAKNRQDENLQDELNRCPFSPQIRHRTPTSKENSWEERPRSMGFKPSPSELLHHPSHQRFGYSPMTADHYRRRHSTADEDDVLRQAQQQQQAGEGGGGQRRRSAIFERLAMEVQMRKQQGQQEGEERTVLKEQQQPQEGQQQPQAPASPAAAAVPTKMLSSSSSPLPPPSSSVVPVDENEAPPPPAAPLSTDKQQHKTTTTALVNTTATTADVAPAVASEE